MPTSPRITVRFLLSHPAHFLALGFGTGLSPIAPGTVGTAFAAVCFAAINNLSTVLATPLSALSSLGALFVLGVAACHITGRHLGVADHGAMVWDEVVAFLLVLTLTPPSWGWQCAAFVLFRFFDIKKPTPIRQIERRFGGGFGVMIDDLIAAFFTLLVLAIAKAIGEMW